MILHAVTPINRVHNIHVAIPEMQNMKLDFTGGQNASPEWERIQAGGFSITATPKPCL